MPIFIVTVPVQGVATFIVTADNEDTAVETAISTGNTSEIEWNVFIWEDAEADPEQPE